MPYLIDGHNLIGQLRSIRLSDPDDEAKLVELLGRFAMRRNLRVVVFFDQGQPGQALHGRGGVAVKFARSPSDADARIIRQLRRFQSPREWILVSNDRAIIAVAEEVGTRVIRASEFAQTLEELNAAAEFDAERAAAHAFVRSDHVSEWLEMFGIDDEEAAKPIDLQRKPQSRQPLKTKKPNPNSATRVQPELDTTPPSNNPVPREADGRVRRSRGGPHPISSEGERLHKPPPPVHPDEIDEWMRFFGDTEKES